MHGAPPAHQGSDVAPGSESLGNYSGNNDIGILSKMTDETSSTLLHHVYVVVPAFNEAAVIDKVLEDLMGILPARQIIVVDDGSFDNTGAIARKFDVITLRHLINRGQGAALATGIEFALRQGAEVIVTFDGDGQHRASEIPELVQPIRDGKADVVLGTRFAGKKASGIGKSRTLVLKLGVIFTRIVSGIKVSDCHNGFRAFSRHAAQQIRINQDGMTHASELLDEIVRNRLHYIELPVHVCYNDYTRQKGQKSTNAVVLGIKFLISRLLK